MFRNINNLYQRNIFLIYLFHILIGISMGWIVIEILYYQSFNLNYFQISLFSLFSALIILLLEIPSGAYADLCGRKKSIILTGIFLFIGTLIYTLSNSFYYFIFGTIFYAAAQAFSSGSISALTFESLKQLKKTNEFQFVIARQHFLLIFTGILTNFVAPIFFDIQRRLPLKISLVFSILTIFSTFFLYEKPIKKNKIKYIYNKYYIQISNSLKYIKTKKEIIWDILFFSIWGVGIGLFGYLINQPFIKQTYSLLEYGLIFSTASAVQAIILYYSKSILIKFKTSKIIIIISIWTLTLPLLIITKNLIFIIFLLGLMWSLGSFTYIIIESNINSKIKNDSKRATILSLNSMFSSLTRILLVPIFGFFLDIISLNQMILFLSVYSLIVGIIFLFIKKYFK